MHLVRSRGRAHARFGTQHDSGIREPSTIGALDLKPRSLAITAGAKSGPEVKQPPMAEMRRQMMAKMNATDADLNRLVTTMNTATGPPRLPPWPSCDESRPAADDDARAERRIDEADDGACSMMKESGASDQKPEH